MSAGIILPHDHCSTSDRLFQQALTVPLHSVPVRQAASVAVNEDSSPSEPEHCPKDTRTFYQVQESVFRKRGTKKEEIRKTTVREGPLLRKTQRHSGYFSGIAFQREFGIEILAF